MTFPKSPKRIHGKGGKQRSKYVSVIEALNCRPTDPGLARINTERDTVLTFKGRRGSVATVYLNGSRPPSVGWWAGTNPVLEEALASSELHEAMTHAEAVKRRHNLSERNKANADTNKKKHGALRAQMRAAWVRFQETNPEATAWSFWHKTDHGFSGTFQTFLKAIREAGR